MSGTPGNHAKIATNGYDIGGQSDAIDYQHMYAPNGIMPQNVGVRQFAPGLFKPQLSLTGFAQRGQGAITAYNLLSPSGVGSAGDTEFITLIALGQNGSPVQGDSCIMFDGTLMPDFKRKQSPADIQKWAAQFRNRGLRMPFFPVLMGDVAQKGSFTSAFWDDGAESVGTLNGGVGMAQILTPTGVAATGNITIGTNAVANDTVVVGGVTYTFKAALTPTAGEVLIGGTAAATLQNLFQALVGSPVGSGVTYAAGTTVGPVTAIYSVPSATVLNITYATTGTGGNSFTLAKTGTGGITVSAATLAGGVAGETATSFVLQSATTSGGSYTTFLTFTSDMTTRKAEIQSVAPGVTINRFLKLIITMSGATQNYAVRVAFGRFFPNQA